jgi:DNA-binding transcriptional MocR family regulator
MTLWSIHLPDSDSPIYARIADAVERDVRSGLLLAGSQLPTHRQLARDLGITPVTVTRAYAEAARRGLVESETGRGTFVRTARRAVDASAEADLSTNQITVPLPAPSRALLERAGEMLTSSTYGTGNGSERHRAAGAAWIGRRTDPSRVIVTAGTQQSLFLAFLATTRAGDAIMTESVTYHGAKAAAAQLNIRLEPLAMDRFGILPDAFERVCRTRTSRVLYTVPSLQNPTAVVMPEKRRRQIADVAAKYGITIIEDDVCGFLLEQPPPPIAGFAPDRTVFITGLGKALAPAVRVGYLTAPDALIARVASALAATTLFTSPVVAEMAATWIEDGTAAKIVAAKRHEVALRNRIVRATLPAATGDSRSGHVWLPLPRRWTADGFADEARRRRVRVASASSFAIGDDIPAAVRLSIGAPPTASALEAALTVLAGIGEHRRQEPVV